MGGRGSMGGMMGGRGSMGGMMGRGGMGGMMFNFLGGTQPVHFADDFSTRTTLKYNRPVFGAGSLPANNRNRVNSNPRQLGAIPRLGAERRSLRSGRTPR